MLAAYPETWLSRDFMLPLRVTHRVLEASPGMWPSPFRGPGSDLAEIREYRTGDSLKNVAWKTSAHRGALFVKEYVAERNFSLLFAVDRAPRMAIGQKHALIMLAVAGIANWALRNHITLGYLDFAKSKPHIREPHTGTAAHDKVLKSASNLHFEARQNSASDLLRYILSNTDRMLYPRSLVIFLSDFIVFPDEELLLNAALRYELVPVVVQDPTWEASFPVFSERIMLPLHDPASCSDVSLTLSVGDQRKVRNRHQQRLAAIAETLQSFRLQPIVLTQPDPVHAQEVFRKRAERFRPGYAFSAERMRTTPRENSGGL